MEFTKTINIQLIIYNTNMVEKRENITIMCLKEKCD